MNIDLQNRHAFVCGSTQGIGWGIARQLATSGARVTLAARNNEKLAEQLAALPGAGHDTFVFDQSSLVDIEQAVQHIKKSEVDILINNTGGPAPGLVSDESWPKFEKALTQQLRCSHALTTAALSHMTSQGFGRVVNVISTSVKVPIYGLGVSNTVRGAVASWSKTLSLEVAENGITVNNILPGFIETGRLRQIIEDRSKNSGQSYEEVSKSMSASVPTKFFGQIEDMGYLAAFLCSDQARYITGTNIPVDGGRTGTF